MFVVLESKQVKTLRRDFSMSKDMRDWPRANLGVAAMMFYITSQCLNSCCISARS